MSTYYNLRCGHCKEQGGFFSRQAWGWGNSDVIENTVFLMAHAECFNQWQSDDEDRLEIISEDNDKTLEAYLVERLKWIRNLQSENTVAGSAFPHGDEWKAAKDGDIKLWWNKAKEELTDEADRLAKRVAEIQAELDRKIALKKHLIELENLNIEERVAECIQGGGHYWQSMTGGMASDEKFYELNGKICSICGYTGNGAMIQ